MAAPARDESLSAAELAVMVLGAVLLGVLTAALYQRFRMPINQAWLHLIRFQVWPFAWRDGSQAQALDRWAGTAVPGRLDWQQMATAATIAGRSMRWLNLLILVPLAGLVWHYADRRRLFRKSFNTRELLARNMPLFPCIAPGLRRNLLKEPMHEGRWAVAKSPTRWVADNGLLLDRDGQPVVREWLITPEGLPNEESPLQQPVQRGMHAGVGLRFDRTRAQQLFAGQLGERLVPLEELPAHRRALAAAFLTFAHAKRSQAQALLDQLSISFREPSRCAESFILDMSGVAELLGRYPVTSSIQRRLAPHSAYTNTWMVALLECAREKGLLPPAEFLWLRPMDRTLWYALHQAGGRTPWCEAAGIWAHYEAESLLGTALEEPEVEAAVEALHGSLIGNGWLREEGGEKDTRQ